MKETAPHNHYIDSQCGYFINKEYVDAMTAQLKKPAPPGSYAAYLKTPDGIQAHIQLSASQGIIDLTCGDRENNVVNWFRIAKEIGINLSGQFYYASLIEAHESRASLYEALSEEKDLIRDYYTQLAQKHREEASYLRGILKEYETNQS